MPPCHYDCTIRNLLKIAVEELENLNRVREDLDDLCFNEPDRHLEVMAKLKVVTEMEKNKMAEAQEMIICTEFGCYLLGLYRTSRPVRKSGKFSKYGLSGNRTFSFPEEGLILE
jgi:hypothetical protein